jgi:hypothetical protein
VQTVIENMKGDKLNKPNSPYRRLRTVRPLSYQCSESSTADEIKSVFELAISRDRTNRDNHFDDTMLVFLDEAGLPKERHEALKIIHEYLDRKEVRASKHFGPCAHTTCISRIFCAGRMHNACKQQS